MMGVISIDDLVYADDLGLLGTLADTKVKRVKHSKAAKARENVVLDGLPVENVACFDYLGGAFNAGGGSVVMDGETVLIMCSPVIMTSLPILLSSPTVTSLPILLGSTTVTSLPILSVAPLSPHFPSYSVTPLSPHFPFIT